MNKFSLPAGTTNRHRWHKAAAESVAKVARTFDMQREIYGTHGGECRESLVTVFSFGVDEPRNPEAVAIYDELGERFGWQITRENADEIAEAFREALPRCMESVPVEDNRTTPEQNEERAKLCREAEDKRQAAAAEKSERVEALALELRKQYPDAEPRGDKSEQARAAANLKRILQARGLRASVTSDSFSMGDSVTARVKTPDVPPEIREELDEIAERFSYSTFDPMTDSSGYKSDDEGEAWRSVHGSTKYCRIEWTRSDENREAVAAFLGDEVERDNSASHRVWSGVHCRAAEFWAQWVEDHKPAAPEPGSNGGGACRIEKHHHTKRGFDFWLVIPAERVERAEFVRLRDSCKAAGGWYSRKWGSTPGGFAFREQEQAGAWAVQEFSGPDSDPQGPQPPPKPKQDTQRAGKFREMAEKVAGEVAAKRGDHLENTPKRQREAMSRRIDADRLERTEQALRALADLMDAGEVPPLLAKFTSKKAIFAALGTRTESQGYYHVADTGEATDESPEAAALWQLIAETWGGKCPEQEKAERLAEQLADVKLRKIPGYFRTPEEVAADMVDKLAINHREPWTLLEPSAGDGALLDAVAELANEPEAVTCYEINSTLRGILEGKGYEVAGGDFLGADRLQLFDAVLMNPPFEKLQDVEHVRRAFGMLKPGGRLVAIMSPGPFFHKTRKAAEFREWFDELGGEVEDIEAGAFKESGTGVASRLVVIDKPEEHEEKAGALICCDDPECPDNPRPAFYTAGDEVPEGAKVEAVSVEPTEQLTLI